MKIIKKILVILFIVIGSLTVINVGASIGINAWANSEGSGEIPKVLLSAIHSFYSPESDEVKKFKETMGGVACGVCHPEEDEYNLQLLKESNTTWVRFDLPSLFLFEVDENGHIKKDAQGNNIWLTEFTYTNANGDIETDHPQQSYQKYKNKVMKFKKAGFKVMAITPYIEHMLYYAGLTEVFKSGGEFTDKFRTMVKEQSEFYANDLKGYVDCFQISNELTIEKWQGGCTTEQVIEYQGELQMKSMHDICESNGVTIGFNFAGYTLYDYPKAICDQYGDYFDYIALDLYLGCFEGSYHTTLVYDLLLNAIYDYSGNKPVMLNEFGYISSGNNSIENTLRSKYGSEFDTEEKIRENISEFLDKFDEVTGENNGSPMTNEARRKLATEGEEAAANYIFQEDQISHIYQALPDSYYLSLYPHTESGQGRFFYDILTRLSHYNFICGMFVYMYSNSDECYQCGGESCPVETGWGLVALNEQQAEVDGYYSEQTVRLKPSYYSVQKVFGRINKSNKKYQK